jgi:hypothetical protein
MGLIEYWSVMEAREGNPTRLATRLRNGDPLSDDERKLAADLLTGKIKPRRRKFGTKSARVRDEIVQTVLLVEATNPRRKREAIIEGVCGVFGVSRRHVFKLLHEIDPRRRRVLEGTAATFAELGYTVECTKPKS